MLTGGKCEALAPAVAGGVAADSWEELKLVLTATACKAAGGAWRGGHDVSGHVFMLVLGSAFLGFEALGSSRSYRNVAGSEAKAKDDSDDESTAEEEGEDSVPIFARRFAWAVAGLSWWMLFMTAIWFHTWLEKVRSSHRYPIPLLIYADDVVCSFLGYLSPLESPTLRICSLRTSYHGEM